MRADLAPNVLKEQSLEQATAKAAILKKESMRKTGTK